MASNIMTSVMTIHGNGKIYSTGHNGLVGQKSGSLITVDAALEQGKDVFVVPGRINDCKSRGCNQLIKNGAYLFENIYDIFDVLKVSHSVDDGASQKKNYYLATKEKIVYAKLSLEPKHINCLAQETGLPVATIIRIVMNLEMKHIIRQTAHNYYVVNV